MNDEQLEAFLLSEGYRNLTWIDGQLCGLRRFIFTTGVVYGLDGVGFKGRFCFDNSLDASIFLAEWDGKTLPLIGEAGCTAIK